MKKEIAKICQQFEIDFESSGLFDCWDGCKKDLIKYFCQVFLSYRNAILEEIINELESNPNPDGSISPNIQHWIEQKQSQIRRKFLTPQKYAKRNQ